MPMSRDRRSSSFAPDSLLHKIKLLASMNERSRYRFRASNYGIPLCLYAIKRAAQRGPPFCLIPHTCRHGILGARKSWISGRVEA